MTPLRPNLCLVAIAAVCAQALSGCARPYSSSAYAIIPVQVVSTPYGAFEVLDRPDLSRLAITALSDRRRHLVQLVGYVREVLPIDVAPVDGSKSPGSEYFDPLMQYFASTGRSCRLIRGVPLVHAQWEFAYSCVPGFDTTRHYVETRRPLQCADTAEAVKRRRRSAVPGRHLA